MTSGPLLILSVLAPFFVLALNIAILGNRDQWRPLADKILDEWV